MIDGDTLKMLIAGAKGRSFTGVGPRTFKESADMETIRLVGAVNNVDTPEMDEPLGVYGNVLLAGFVQAAGENLRMDVLGASGGGAASSGGRFDPTARSLGRLYSMTPTGGVRDYADILYASGLTSDPASTLKQEALDIFARERRYGRYGEGVARGRSGEYVDIRGLDPVERRARVSSYNITESSLPPWLRGVSVSDKQRAARGQDFADIPNFSSRVDEVDMYEFIDAVAQAAGTAQGFAGEDWGAQPFAGGAFNPVQVFNEMFGSKGTMAPSGDVFFVTCYIQ